MFGSHIHISDVELYKHLPVIQFHLISPLKFIDDVVLPDFNFESKKFIHSSFVVNFCKPSVKSMYLDHLRFLITYHKKLKTDGIVLHVGSYKGYTEEEGILNSIRHLSPVQGKEDLLLENGSGSGSVLSNINSVCRVADSLNCGVCLDLAHAWAAGYDLTSEDVITNILNIIGDKLKLIHLNGVFENLALGCGKDKHGSLLDTVYFNSIKVLITYCLYKNIPMVLERKNFPEFELNKLNSMFGLERNIS